MPDPSTIPQTAAKQPPPPHRVQLKRSRGWRMPGRTLKVDRSTPYGNPWQLGDRHPFLGQLETTDAVVEAFDLYLADWAAGRLTKKTAAQYQEALAKLKGHHLACWCALDEPCHADLWLKRANPAPPGKPKKT